MEGFAKWVLDNFGNWQALVAYLFVGVLSVFSGAVGHFYRRNAMPADKRPPFNWGDFSFDQAASLLIAIIMFWLTLNRNLPPLLTAVAIALVAFWGTQAMIYVLRLFRQRIKGVVDDLGPPTK